MHPPTPSRAAHDAERAATHLLQQIGAMARRYGMTRIARETGLNRENLYKAFSGKTQTSFVTVAKVLRVLGLKLELHQLNGETGSLRGSAMHAQSQRATFAAAPAEPASIRADRQDRPDLEPPLAFSPLA